MGLRMSFICDKDTLFQWCNYPDLVVWRDLCNLVAESETV